jgi:hypothetical protein
MPISFSSTFNTASSTASQAMIIKSRGRHVLWPSTTSIDVSSSSLLWMRWQYAIMSNLTVRMTNQPVDSQFYPRDRGHVQCYRNVSALSSVWCNAGLYDVSGHGTYPLLINMTQSRGVLPAHLYFLLTRGHADHLRAESIRQASLKAASIPPPPSSSSSSPSCILLRPRTPTATSLTLCSDDASYFDMIADDEDENSTIPIILGSSFFWKNATIVQVNGHASTITVQFAPPDENVVLAWQWAGVAFFLAATLVYGLWALGPTTLSIGRYLHRVLHGQGQGKDTDEWPMDWGLTLGAILLLPIGIVSIVIGWVGGTLAGQLGNAVPVVDNIDFTLLAAATTALLGVQLIVLLITWIGWEASTAPPCRTDCSRQGQRHWRKWFASHVLGIRVAWVRHQTIATGALASMTMAAFPLAFFGGQMGNTIMVLFLVPPGLWLVYHQTYYSIALMAVALGSKHAHAATLAVALLQVVAGLFFDVIFLLLYLRPVLLAGSPLFGDAYMLAAASLLLVLVMVGAIAAFLWEMAQVIKSVADTVKEHDD